MDRAAGKRSILSPLAIPRINQAYKNARRMRHILATLGKHGFSQLIESVGLAKLVSSSGGGETTTTRHSAPERLCLAFEELGPAFVKFGQMLASRPDLVTPTVAAIFRRLQDNVQPEKPEEIRAVIEREFDGSVETLFREFGPRPIGAASVAQVHRAVLMGGEDVVVKIQRPGIDRVLETDLSILHHLARLGGRYIPELAVLDPAAIVEEFARTIKSATDFTEEAHNIEAFRTNFEKSPDVTIPKVYWELTSKRVLTMEAMEGIPLHDVDRLRSENYDLKKICEVGVDTFFRQVFMHGLFHADLHGGNIFVLPGNRIALVDFGEVGRLGSNAQTSIANIFMSLLSRDFTSVAREYLELGTAQQAVDVARFADSLEKFLGPLFGRKIRDVRFSDVLTRAAAIAAEHRIRLPRDLVLVGRVIVTMEDLVRKLDPEFDVLSYGGKITAEIVGERLRPDRLAKDLVWNLRDLGDLSKTLPTQVKFLLQRLTSDSFTLPLEMKGFTKALGELNRSSRRLSLSVVIAGLWIGSSILVHSNQGPRFFDMPVLGLAGYCSAGLLTASLLISLLRSRGN